MAKNTKKTTKKTKTVEVIQREGFEALNEISLLNDSATLATGDLCDRYGKVKKWLPATIAFVALIPVSGPKIAATITFLRAIADKACDKSEKK